MWNICSSYRMVDAPELHGAGGRDSSLHFLRKDSPLYLIMRVGHYIWKWWGECHIYLPCSTAFIQANHKTPGPEKNPLFTCSWLYFGKKQWRHMDVQPSSWQLLRLVSQFKCKVLFSSPREKRFHPATYRAGGLASCLREHYYPYNDTTKWDVAARWIMSFPYNTVRFLFILLNVL